MNYKSVMKLRPLVCVCVPVFNASSTIVEMLHSILQQSYTEIRVKVIDNASTDDTVEKVKKILDPRVSLYINSENIGGENNFTRCIEMSEGEYTCIYHADDVYNRMIIERQVAYMNCNPKAGAVFSDAYLINEGGERIGRQGNFGRVSGHDGCFGFAEIFKGILRYSNFFICPSAMIRTEICQREIMIWNGADYKTSADLDVWLRILQNHEVGILPEPLINYRISSNQWSAQLRGRVDRADMFLVIDDYLRRDHVRSILNKADYKNYNRLDRTDRVIRSMNWYLRGENKKSQLLLVNFFQLDSFVAAVTSYRGLATFVAALVVFISIKFKLDKIGVECVRTLKKISNR